MAGIIKYLAPIDNASGKIFGLKEKFVSVTRQTGNRIRGCAFMGKRDTVNHPVSEHELEIRSKFSALTKRVAARLKKKDNPRYEADMALFRKQTVFTSFKAWLWDQVKNHLKGIDSVTFGSKTLYPGGKGVELNTSESNKIVLNLIPGTGATLGDITAKINGSNVSNPQLAGDTISLLIPAAEDGAELKFVSLVCEGGSYRVDFA